MGSKGVYSAPPPHGAHRKGLAGLPAENAARGREFRPGEAVFQQGTFRALRRAEMRATGQHTNLTGWSVGEDKEREGKGRDACRGPRRDEVFLIRKDVGAG